MYGVAQPRINGLKAVLSVLGCSPILENASALSLTSPQVPSPVIMSPRKLRFPGFYELSNSYNLRCTAEANEPSIPLSPSSSASSTNRTRSYSQPITRRCVFFSTREEPVIYISGRPFVLRDASDPTEALHLADRADILEGIEERLKSDILAEAERFGGLLMTHYEDCEWSMATLQN